MYYRNANCAVVVYDITQTTSLEKARTWIRELQRQADPSIVIALCGNKLDLAARRQVSQEDVDNARAEGATDREVHDTVLIAASFSMFNRYVDGLASWTPEDPATYEEMGRRMAKGYVLPQPAGAQTK